MFNKKGQLNSVDLLISTTVFALLIVFLIGFWFVEIMDIQKITKKTELEAQAISLSDILIKSPGVPKNWENENSEEINMIGLASSDNIIDEDKVKKFINMSYSENKEIFGIENDFYFYIEDLNGNRLYQTGNSTIEKQSVTVTRFGVLDNIEVKMRLIVHG
ncbi:MAG: hypothetical protein PHU63_02170 [Candidatus ainarchaeum sp.]|nr:hypothetical protein [Candidatus ainarchaeum sp.]